MPEEIHLDEEDDRIINLVLDREGLEAKLRTKGIAQFSPKFNSSQIEKYAKNYGYGDEEEIKHACAAANRGWMNRDEFLSIAKWKSPRPQKHHKQNSELLIKQITTSAFAMNSCIEQILLLTCLAGIQVRSATAILHLCFPSKYPLLDIWAMVALGVNREVVDKWSELDWLRCYPSYTEFCQKLAREVNVSLRVLDRAMWAYGKKHG